MGRITLEIKRISERDAATLDLAENNFTSNEILDVSLVDGDFRHTVRSVEAFSKTYDAEGSLDDVEVFGAYIDGALVGKIELASTWNELAAIEHIVVARSHRKLGVASGLIDFAKSWASGKQLKGIRLETQTNNVPACKLYFLNGFEIGGIDRMSYRTQTQVASETALYMYWFPIEPRKN